MSRPALDIQSVKVVLELTINTHPDVRPRPLTRRPYPVDGILCLPLGGKANG
jgi:hypothetical protein